MANNLTAAQRTAFARNQFKAGDFQLTIQLTDNSSTYDLSSHLLSVTGLEDSLYNYNDSNPGTFQYPTIVVELRNPSGKYTVGHASGVMNAIQGWYIKIQLQETLSNPSGVDLIPLTSFPVANVEHSEPGKVTITCAHPLFRYWGKVWNREADSWPMAWQGLKHFGPDWSS